MFIKNVVDQSLLFLKCLYKFSGRLIVQTIEKLSIDQRSWIHVTSFPVERRGFLSSLVGKCYVMSCYIIVCYDILCYDMLCYIMLHCVMSCCVMLCYVMLYYAILFHVMVCYVMLYYVMLRYFISSIFYVILCHLKI